MNPKDLCNLPKDVRFIVAMQLNHSDLTNLCLAGKKCDKICKDERFWQAKIVGEYGINTKPEDWTWRQFYYRLSRSGKLTIDKLYIDNHVIKYRSSYNNGYYITANGQLHRYQISPTFEYSLLMLYLLKDEIIEMMEIIEKMTEKIF